jgi:hypothetical protein
VWSCLYHILFCFFQIASCSKNDDQLQNNRENRIKIIIATNIQNLLNRNMPVEKITKYIDNEIFVRQKIEEIEKILKKENSDGETE